jgi:adenylate kinase family enzyme
VVGVPSSACRRRGTADRLLGATLEIKRVAIVGSGGAGKSTLALALSETLDLPVIHLDKHYWQAGWVPTPKDAWLERQRQLVAQERWIIDGNYGSTMDLRLAAADTVIFLDTPRLRCVQRVLKRTLSYRPGTRPDMAAGCHERFDLEFLRWVWRYPAEQRPKILEMLARQRSKKTVIHLKSDREVAALLDAVRRSSPTEGGLG